MLGLVEGSGEKGGSSCPLSPSVSVSLASIKHKLSQRGEVLIKFRMPRAVRYILYMPSFSYKSGNFTERFCQMNRCLSTSIFLVSFAMFSSVVYLVCYIRLVYCFVELCYVMFEALFISLYSYKSTLFKKKLSMTMHEMIIFIELFSLYGGRSAMRLLSIEA